MIALKLFAKLFVMFIVLTVIGQIQINNLSLENRYHHLVNSEKFQSNYEKLGKTLTWPATWTYNKISQAIKKSPETQAR